MAKLAKQSTGPTPPVAGALYVQHAAPVGSDYSEFTRYAPLLPDAAAMPPEPVLYAGRPQGELVGQCAQVLLSPQVGTVRRFLSGLRYVGTGPGGLRCYVGDAKQDYRNPAEKGRTLLAVIGEAGPGCPGCLLLFISARAYARRRAQANATYAQRLFRDYVRPRLSGWLQKLPAPAQLF